MKSMYKPTSAFRIIRDNAGYAKAVAYNQQYILRIVEGSSINEHFVRRIVAMLRCAEKCSNCRAKLERSISEWRRINISTAVRARR